MRRALILLFALLPAAASGGVPAATDARLDYKAYAHGLPILRMHVALDLWPGGYRMWLDYRTIGLVGFFYRGWQHDRVAGSWRDGRPAPRSYRAIGLWHGDRHRLVMDYAGGRPEVRAVLPPISTDREAVPPAEQVGTIDTLSALVDLLRRIAATGGCDDQVHTFDGRRLSVIAARDAGHTVLPHRAGAAFAGPALRCDFTGRMQAGFLFGQRRHDSRPMHGSAWFAPLRPGGQDWPVRLRFQTDWFGDVTMVLTAAQVGPPSLTAERADDTR
ncbi:MAG: DUF3108 domain-containing protein [Rhodospirillales bacterium]|nr:DUF3108 domain-containing protein [Rhodospirillales bacterium]